MAREGFHGSGSVWLSGFKIRRKHASLLQEVSISDDDVEKHRPSSPPWPRSSPSHNKRTRKKGMNVKRPRQNTSFRFGYFIPLKEALLLLEISLQGEKVISQPTQTCRGMGRIGGYHQQAAPQKESQLIHQ